jgi:hypothetical protein
MNYAQAVQQIINTSPGVGGGGGVQNISGLTPVSDINNIPHRTAFGSNGVGIGLPATVNCTFDGGGSGTVDMTWAIGSYNPGGTAFSTVAFYSDAVYNIVGTPVTTGSITNTGNITDTVQVTVKTPWFPLTSTVKAVYDLTQLATSTDNSYGTVDASNNITVIKSVAPGTTGINLNSSGTAPKLSGNKAVMIGTGFWVQPSPTTDFDYLHYHATASLVKHTSIFAVNVTDTNSVVGIAGNNGFNAAANNGVDFICNTTTTLQGLALITYGNGTTSVGWENTSMNPLGSDTVMAVTLDNAIANGTTKVLGYTGTTLFTATSNGTGLTDITPATPTFRIGNYGGAGNMSGSIYMLVFLNGAPETDAVRNKLVQDIAAHCGITL